MLENFRVRFQAGKERREATLAQIAEACGVGVSTVGAWAQGANFPEIEVQPKLAEFLGVSVQFLIHGIPVKGDPLTWQAEEERRPDYVKSRKEAVGDFPKESVTRRRMTLTPKFSSTPTREDCEAYLKAILDAAPTADVSYAFILRKLKKALPVDEFEPDEKE